IIRTLLLNILSLTDQYYTDAPTWFGAREGRTDPISLSLVMICNFGFVAGCGGLATQRIQGCYPKPDCARADGAWIVCPGAMTARGRVANTLACDTEVVIIYHLT